MPLTPLATSSFSLLPALLHRQDEWDILSKYLSLSDLGNLRAVSSEFRTEVTPAQIERAAQACLWREEGGGISPDDLQRFRFHPAVQGLVDEGYLASACLSSLCHVRQSLAGRYVEPTFSYFPLSLDHSEVISLPQTKFGHLVVCQPDDHGRLVPRSVFHARDAGQAVTLAIPDGLNLAGPSAASFGGNADCTRQLLASAPELLLLADRAGHLHSLDMKDGTLTGLPLTPFRTPLIATHLSSSSRFVAVLTQTEGGESRLQCYDRELGRQSIDARIDRNAYQITVGDDGRVFAGAHEQGYVFHQHGEIASIHPYVNGINQGFNAIFRLSPDGRFLIRNCFSPLYGENDVMLQDLQKHGREIILSRIAPPSANGWRMQPASIAFSVLNRLVAIAYIDGAVQVFDLHDDETINAGVLLQSFVPRERPAGVHISFDGFSRVHILSQFFPEGLHMYTLDLAP